MKPTTDSLKAALELASNISTRAMTAMIELASANLAFECDCPQQSIRKMEAARCNLANLRRTQMAALKNIDDAIASAKGGAQ